MGNNPPEPCTPFTPCWCETRPNHPQCKQTVPIDNNYFTIFSIVVILFVVFNKLNKL